MILDLHKSAACAALVAALGFSACGATLFAATATTTTVLQPAEFANRPVSEVRYRGLQRVSEQLVRNQIRLAPGDPFDRKVVDEDIVRLTYLGQFRTVSAEVQQLETGAVQVTYVFAEQPVISDVRVVGNKAISDQELLNRVVLRAGDPVDPYLIDRGVQEIKRLYEGKGHFVTDVQVDRELLDESGVLMYRVREGPRVRVRDIAFEGNEAMSDRQLNAEIRSRTRIFLLRSGDLSREMLDDDVDRLRKYYLNRGYLDAQVGRRIDISPNQRDAVVVFFVEEGRQYLVDSIRINGAQVFTEQQIRENMELNEGDVFSDDKLRRTREALRNMYGKLGYINNRIEIERPYHEVEPKVDVVVHITEGTPFDVGKVTIRGNQITKDRVILRQVRGMEPGRRFDRAGIETTQQRLKESPLFGDAKVTVLGQDTDSQRDVLIEVTEQNTGSLSFGAGVSSDAGVIGAIELTQRNFDIADWPEDFGEFFSGKAFRGAGQQFQIAVQPGNETSRYAVSFAEPYFLDTKYFFDTSLYYYSREQGDYDEQRMGGTLGLGQRFGDVWSARVNARAEQIDISSVEPGAPADILAVEGDSMLTSLGFVVTRATTDSGLFPTRGSRTSVGISQAGALGGDYDFTKATAQWRRYWTVDEDFLGRKTVLTLKLETGYIFQRNEAPIFERFFAGGHRTFRGFQYRGIGPRGLTAGGAQTDDSVGGDFLFLAGLEYNLPIYQEIVRMVFFTDTGTVQKDIGLDEYRVAVGFGLRLAIPFLGQAPFAFDFAFPILKEDDDETRLFSFDIALPF